MLTISAEIERKFRRFKKWEFSDEAVIDFWMLAVLETLAFFF